MIHFVKDPEIMVKIIIPIKNIDQNQKEKYLNTPQAAQFLILVLIIPVVLEVKMHHINKKLIRKVLILKNQFK